MKLSSRSRVPGSMFEPLENRQLMSAALPATPHVGVTVSSAAAHASAGLSQQQLNAAAVSSYVYGYPLVYQYFNERVGTDAANPGHNLNFAGPLAPVNELVNFPLAPLTAGYGPNAETLYTAAWINLKNEPLVLHVPNTNGRFYSVELLDGWTDAFAVIGKRTTGTAEANYALVGPNWHGNLPAGVKEVKSPTDIIQFLARTLVLGPNDIPNAEKIRDQYTLTPLSKFGKPYTPPINVPVDPTVDTKDPIAKQVTSLSGQQYFTLLANLLKDNPPLPGDGPAVALLKQIGLTVGKSFNPASLSAGQKQAIDASVAVAQKQIPADGIAYSKEGATRNGWKFGALNVENWGTSYGQRAGAAFLGYNLTNLPQDAIYPGRSTDAEGQPLTGANNYTLTFPAGQLPRAKEFWSLTLYQNDGTLAGLKLYPNSINRYEIGNRTPYKLNPDGSLTIYIQHDNPGGAKESNWLPAPTGAFSLTLRLYSPEPSAFSGAWQPPQIVNTTTAANLTANAVKAYEYLYPLVVQGYTEKIQTDTSSPNGDTSVAPVNELFNNSLAPLNNNTGPNADTLYTGGWLDLAQEPIVLHVPNIHNRFYSFELGDAWTNTFEIIGRHTTGTSAADYAIVGPDWQGTLPKGVKEVRSPTDLVDFLGRTLVYGPADLKTADALRQQFSLTPLSKYGTHYVPPTNVPYDPLLDTTTPAPQQVAKLTPVQFFEVAAQMLKHNPALPGDAPALQWLKSIGLTAGQDFLPAKLSPQQLLAINNAVPAAQAKIGKDLATWERSGPASNGWFSLTLNLEEWGTDYADRAGAASVGGSFTLANPHSEAIYLSAVTDHAGKPLDGTKGYELTFAKGQYPPSNDFWSVTLYDQKAELYQNPLNRYAIGNRSAYKTNPDGSLTIYVGHTSPGAGKESNWIPAPAGPFILTIRIYGPEKSALDGTWVPPSIEQV